MGQPNIQVFTFVYLSVKNYETVKYTNIHLALYILLSLNMRQPNIQVFIIVYLSVSKYETAEYAGFQLFVYSSGYARI